MAMSVAELPGAVTIDDDVAPLVIVAPTAWHEMPIVLIELAPWEDGEKPARLGIPPEKARQLAEALTDAADKADNM